MAEEYFSDRDRSSDEEVGGEEEHEIPVDYSIQILTDIEYDGARYDVRANEHRIVSALAEGGSGKGTILHELVKWDPKKHNIDVKKLRKDDKIKEVDGKKRAPPGSTNEIREKYQSLVEMLMELDPTILTVTDEKGQTALYTAVDMKKWGILKLLCEVGSVKCSDQVAKSIAIRPKTLTNCIHETILATKFAKAATKRRMFQVLVDHCDDEALSQQDNERNTPLHVLMKHECLASFDEVDRIKPLIETMVTKGYAALTKQNKLGLTPFQYLVQVCRKAFREDLKLKGDKVSKIDYSKQGERGERKADMRPPPQLTRDTTVPQSQTMAPPPPPQGGLQKRDTFPAGTPVSPVTGKPPGELILPQRPPNTRYDTATHDRTTSRRLPEEDPSDRGAPRIGQERGSSRRPDANSKSTRLPTRIEGGESQTSRRAALDKSTNLSANDITHLYAFIENLVKRVALQRLELGEASMALYGRVPVTNKQLDFNLIGTTQPLSADMIKEYFSFLSFESILKFVALPRLKTDEAPPAVASAVQVSKRNQKAEVKSPDHYRQIFDWLRPNVQEVLQIIIEDDLENPHSDEDIEEAVKGFGVEEWKWRKYDINSATLLAAASDVKVLHLYTTGNQAVLQGWLAPNGLKQLRKLEKVVLHIKEPQSERTKENIEKFSTELKRLVEESRYEKQIDYATLLNITNELRGEQRSSDHIKLDRLFSELEKVASSKKIAGTSESTFEVTKEYLEPEEDKSRQNANYSFGPGDRGLVHRWLDNVNKCRAWMTNMLPRKGIRKIKVCLVDDGVDASHGKLKGNIQHGISFGAAQAAYHNVPSSYYASLSGHGTLMASLITFVCPWVEFYVAKLDDHGVRNGGGFTAKSAARAIEWAVEHNVDIISMSWTIDADDTNGDDLTQLGEALSAAANKQILMFCAARDEGLENANKEPWPAAANTKAIFKIGAAAPTGVSSTRVNPKAVHYLLPGTDLREFWQYADLPEMSAVDGSSSATALASGLAALILVIMSQDTSGQWIPRKDIFAKIKSMFNSVKQGDIPYLQVWSLWPDSALEERNVFDSERKKELIRQFVSRLYEKSNGNY